MSELLTNSIELNGIHQIAEDLNKVYEDLAEIDIAIENEKRKRPAGLSQAIDSLWTAKCELERTIAWYREEVGL